MRHSTCCLAVAGSLLTLLAPGLVAQTPRDVFWSASDLVSVSANPAGKKLTRASVPTHRPSTAHAAGAAHIAPQLIAQNGYGEAPHFVQASLHVEQIGLRYSLMLRDADGGYREVSPGTVFHAGDHLRLSLMSNEPGYLYVISQGSSGSWSPLFPGKGAAPEANHIAAGQVSQIPNDPQAFQFDTTPGTDKLFVVLSKERIADLDSAIERLKTPAAAAPPSPSNAPGAVLEATNHIPNDLVQRLASRDLTLVTEQKVDAKGSAEAPGEKAVYVVAKQQTGSPTQEVVASISLNHQ